MTDGVLFNVSDAAIAAQNALVEKLLKALGPIRGHRSDVEPAMWGFAVSVLRTGGSAPTQTEIDSFLSEVEANSTQSVRLIRPCHNVRLTDNIRAITIGPVTARRTATALPALRRSCPKIKFHLSDESHTDSGSLLDIFLPPVIWDVEVTAAKQVRNEEATWLIDVTLSLLRLATKASDLGPLAPAIGKVEAHPILSYPKQQNQITIGPSSSYSFGGWELPNAYELGRSAKRALRSKKAQSRIELVFAPPKNSLAQRFAQGLGWLSRGRQSADRPTRLLYFFTAVEALLSDSDKTAPVVQTVARHAAVILSDDNQKRAQISKDIRGLYGLRSSLVHTGKRGIYDQDSNTIQYVAELLFLHVWTRLDLAMTHESFVLALSEASYGVKLRTTLK